jgi:hypothetical protein
MSSLRSASKCASVRLSYLIVLVLVVVGLGASATSALAAKFKSPQVEIVTKGEFPAKPWKGNTEYFHTIQAAVNNTKDGDWVLIEPGEYSEEVRVEGKGHSDIWIRGMGRKSQQEVFLNGEPNGVPVACERDPCPEGRNGIDIIKENEVFVENLTVANFNKESLNGAGGNEIWWNGGEETGKIGAWGWWGQYLTAYDTGQDGGYGIFTNNETDGSFQHVYASGFDDSGLYIGACPECEALVDYATFENNALGYSGSNAGGNLVIENSVFSHNTTGIAPNSENPGDGPPPQNGACEHVKPLKKHVNAKHEVSWVGTLPKFSTTDIARCTIIRNDVISDNDNFTAPADNSAAKAPWGAGVELPGTYGDLVENNTITNNPSDGVLAFEYPNPYPPTKDTIYFQLSGNRISENKFEGNGSLDGAYSGEVLLEGGIFGSKESTNNCLLGNEYSPGGKTYPANIEGTWSCNNSTTPNGVEEIGAVGYLVGLQEESEHRTMVDQPAPPEQAAMPNPCWESPLSEACP